MAFYEAFHSGTVRNPNPSLVDGGDGTRFMSYWKDPDYAVLSENGQYETPYEIKNAPAPTVTINGQTFFDRTAMVETGRTGGYTQGASAVFRGDDPTLLNTNGYTGTSDYVNANSIGWQNDGGDSFGGLLSNAFGRVAPLLAVAGGFAALGASAWGASALGEAGASSALPAVDYSLGSAPLGTGGSHALSVYGAGGSGYAPLGVINTGGVLTGSAMTGSNWLGTLSDGYSALKNVNSVAGNVAKLTGSGSTLKGTTRMTFANQTIPLGQNLSGQSDPMTTGGASSDVNVLRQAGTGVNPANGISMPVAIGLGVAAVVVVWLLTKGKGK